MIDIETYIKSLKLTWVRKMFQGLDNVWVNLFSEINDFDKTLLLQMGSDFTRTKSRVIKNYFWKEVLEILSTFMETVCSKEEKEILQMPLWFNPFIRINKKYVFYKSMYDKGFHHIQDLFQENGEFLSYAHFTKILNKPFPFTKFFGLKNAILKTWPNLMRNFSKVQMPIRPNFLHTILKDKNGCRRLYDILIKTTDSKLKSEEKWERCIGLPNSFDWEKVNRTVFDCTKETKLKWFQYRIIHRILGTKQLLFKCKIKNDPRCSFCNTSAETIEHLFYYCRHSKNIWVQLENWFNTVDFNISFDIKTVIFGYETGKYAPINLMILTVKHYIFQQSRKDSELSFSELKKSITYQYTVEQEAQRACNAHLV